MIAITDKEKRELKIAFYKAINFLTQNGIDVEVTVKKKGEGWTAHIDCSWPRGEKDK